MIIADISTEITIFTKNVTWISITIACWWYGDWKHYKDSLGVRQQQAAAYTALTDWNDEYSKCPLLAHSCPFIHRRPLEQRST